MDDTSRDATQQIHPGRDDGHRDQVDEQDRSVTDSTESCEQPQAAAAPKTLLPDIPSGELSFDLGFATPEQTETTEFQKLQKRASNVMKLSEENDKLKEELKAMTERLEAAERRKTELQARRQQVMEPPSS
ncbi:hypothetical protein CC1G_04301 [Coprinopsis cinerea okayama7|uniref:Uncharacterized protein n=1 Tax=Coprinopsis cinerea (strain Okayama-7 / 130 / ATCC MYA-4618 / FGSC 9003) TaxID=240176 RepID=A8NFM3_COPC7|nr:hypothetical protein CC1G_04301 [Coprinopsis cinerea okayama7\|eukprot:XP_001833322.1 hypothetical protein CC1G_04301 [Coprinopsis cinerea okayama7\